ncbi:MAG TPA: lamin tail domain-containing protein, partial [Tepidisphaeraceae bacterium]|nr:lamin tail domain-containing protein [Tepidisphaeraceae bacterium]
MRLIRVVGMVALASVLCCTWAGAGVVINEIFYHAPNDLEDLQWIELFNSGDQPVDISGWSLDQGRLFTFPKDTAIAAEGYLVVALSTDQFRLNYRLPSLGPLKKPLKHGGGQIELQNAAGERVDLAKYRDHDPWPASPDGYSSSLERICPSASGEIAENWNASPLPPEQPRPGGTPGKKNWCFNAVLPPTIRVVSEIPEDA